MVDPTKGIGPIQNLPSGKPPADDKPRAADADDAVKSSAPVVDQVEISAEAQQVLSASQAEQAAKDVRSELQKDLDRVLGIDPSFAEQVGLDEA